MSEKVLGLKKKDVEIDWFTDDMFTITGKGSFVPVVSVEWLEKLIEKHNKKEIKIPTYWTRPINQTAFIAGVNYEFEEFKFDLLSVVRQQSKSEAKKKNQVSKK